MQFERHVSMQPAVHPSGPGPAKAATDPLTESEGLDLVGLLSVVDETSYVWDLNSDRIDWEANAAHVLGVDDVDDIATGSRFQFFVAPEYAQERARALAPPDRRSGTRGHAYRTAYKFCRPGGRSASQIWVEDQGLWWPGPDGRPARARGIIRIVDDRFREEERLRQSHDHDQLTGQLNRIRLTEALATQIERSRTNGLQHAFLVVAVNNLSVINETFGFHVGDEVIAQVGLAIRSKMRGCDIIGRYASNKFGILISECGPGAMKIAAERFMKATREAVIKGPGFQLSVTVSVGGVIFPEQAQTVQCVLNNALKALDSVRCKRVESFTAYQPNSKSEHQRRRNASIADDVMDALDDHRMRLVLQPMIGAKSGRAEIYECLLRMERRDGSLMPAGEFIPIVEQLGLSRLIDRRTLELAVELLNKHPKLTLSLNVSGLTCGDHEWLAALRRLTGCARDLTSRLIIEITETAAIDDVDQSINFVDTLKEIGCRVAIDDFGAGYTSFKNLKVLNVDMVKIDGAFIKNLADDTSDQVFLKTMIELSSSFGLECVAEWVGDERCVRLLIAAGIDYLQGFHYGLPIPAEDIGALIEAA